MRSFNFFFFHFLFFCFFCFFCFFIFFVFLLFAFLSSAIVFNFRLIYYFAFYRVRISILLSLTAFAKLELRERLCLFRGHSFYFIIYFLSFFLSFHLFIFHLFLFLAVFFKNKAGRIIDKFYITMPCLCRNTVIEIPLIF